MGVPGGSVVTGERFYSDPARSFRFGARENAPGHVENPEALRGDQETVLPADQNGRARMSAVAGQEPGHRTHEDHQSQEREKREEIGGDAMRGCLPIL